LLSGLARHQASRSLVRWDRCAPSSTPSHFAPSDTGRQPCTSRTTTGPAETARPNRPRGRNRSFAP
jgi:hypothetical protein